MLPTLSQQALKSFIFSFSETFQQGTSQKFFPNIRVDASPNSIPNESRLHSAFQLSLTRGDHQQNRIYNFPGWAGINHFTTIRALSLSPIFLCACLDRYLTSSSVVFYLSFSFSGSGRKKEDEVAGEPMAGLNPSQEELMLAGSFCLAAMEKPIGNNNQSS
ncbi:hypothetical protein Tco_0492398 [Tanacetum coccineum]